MIQKALMIAMFALLSLPLAAGCGGEKEKTVKKARTSPAQIEANQIWADRCVTCHGEKGLGDGPGSAGLDPKPRDFSDPSWEDSVTDEHIEKIIVYGGAAVGKSPAMPSNPDLAEKPAVVKALREHVRSLKKQ